MGITDIAQLATNMAGERSNQAIGVAVMRKALDAQATTAAALINALPSVPNLPAHLGQNIDTVA